MSVAQLHRPDRVVDVLSSARSAVQAAAEVPAASLGVDELTDAIAGVAVLEAQAGCLRLSLLAEADRRRVAQSLGATGTDAWAARLTGSNRAEMAGVVRLARLLEETYDATREAFAAGLINQAQVKVIVRAAERLPERGRRASSGGPRRRAGGQGDQRGWTPGGCGRRAADAAGGRRDQPRASPTSPTSTRRPC